ncbi:uncharacterized protein LOC127876912 [Dreissena polymorpha]|uniref:uncharacterized protein LOC127876912 n=1 Tax=Dreissena polymorpha TaxID=45954 RepID=UPI002264B7CD|nr:uncharacterized protein LOC127876912 [Dreissena polymorpha]
MDTVSKTNVFVLFLAIVLRASGGSSQPLPGIFSSSACDGTNTTGQLASVCHCVHKYDVFNLTQFCSNTMMLADCIQEQMSSSETNNSYIRLVFDRGQFMKKANLTCSHRQVLGHVHTCTAKVSECDSLFLKKISATKTWDEEQSCSVGNSLGVCYWHILQHCPGRMRHMWSVLAEVYVTNKCTKYDHDSFHFDCNEIVTAYHDEKTIFKKRKNYTECLEIVSTNRECIEIHKLDSIHNAHVWQNMEFQLERFTQFEKLRCTLETGRERGCNTDIVECLEPFDNSAYILELMIKNGTIPTTNQICELYDRMIECVQKAADKCPTNKRHSVAYWCAVMPKSCHCPIDEKGNMKSVNGSGLSHHTHLLLYLCFWLVLVMYI